MILKKFKEAVKEVKYNVIQKSTFKIRTTGNI